jgi:hypothetical protein
MGQWEHGGGFSVDGSVRIEAADRAGRERLLRYCARPPFALERLRELDPQRLLYEGTKPGPGGNASLLLTLLSCSTASPLWCRHHASAATATWVCWRGRLLAGNCRCDRERPELAGYSRMVDDPLRQRTTLSLHNSY